MEDRRSRWPRLYATGLIAGAAVGLLLSLGASPQAPDWPAEWGVNETSRWNAIVYPVAGGALVGLLLAAASHLGAAIQLRRRSNSVRSDRT
jgi:hypothetical protein